MAMMGMAVVKRDTLIVSMAYMFLLVSVGAIHKIDQKEDEAGADRITKLPGQPNVSFQQFSGYVTVNKVAGRALFYWLTETVHQPDSSPLIIWFNGGPGCSSLAYGASEEIGPFKIHKDGSSLYLNKFSWNKEANLLFIESPAGVGFSYTNTSSDLYDSGDLRTATDALEFVIGWLDRFPRYKNRMIYLTGESYAGHYVTQLAHEILAYNSRTKLPINLKGIMVGNAVIDSYYDNLGTVTYWWSHALISDKLHKEILNTCDLHKEDDSPECHSLFKQADTEFGKIDPYNIYAPVCNKSSSGTNTDTGIKRKSLRFPHQPYRPISMRMSGYDPCAENYAEIYYNRPDVQKAFHANTTNIPYKWTSCSGTLNHNWTNWAVSVLPIFKEMIAAGLRIWVISGDVDSVVPVTASRFSLAQLNLTTKTPWYPWYVSKNEVGGWTEIYEGLTFATVRGAGHEVPVCKPKAALQLFKSFLSGNPLLKLS